MIKKWETVEDRFVLDLKIFQARIKRRTNPVSFKDSDFVMLDSPNWVNIIPITKEGKIVMVEQYRHGNDSISVELPGGMVEMDENFADAAMRECIEETGFEGDDKIEQIGQVFPNPAFMNNKCTTFLWKNCELKYKQNLDSDELINIRQFTIDEIRSMIETGKINHAIILNALFFYFMKMKSNFIA